MRVYTSTQLATFLEHVRASNLPDDSKAMAEELAREVTALGAELARMREQHTNETVNRPSSKQPEWNKDSGPETPPRRRKRKLGGRRPGSGNRSKTHLIPDRTVHNHLEQCPDCGTDLTDQAVLDANRRIIEDTEPPAKQTTVTEETSDRKWCPTCRKIVSPKSELALPRSDIGLYAAVRMAYLWVVMALSLPNIQTYLSRFMRLAISTSGISSLMIRIADILTPVAEEIRQDVRIGFQIWADETGWRVRGVTWWLWAFANETSAYYYASPSRGSPVVTLILGKVFAGVLITDAWSAYNASTVCSGRRAWLMCFAKSAACCATIPRRAPFCAFTSCSSASCVMANASVSAPCSAKSTKTRSCALTSGSKSAWINSSPGEIRIPFLPKS